MAASAVAKSLRVGLVAGAAAAAGCNAVLGLHHGIVDGPGAGGHGGASASQISAASASSASSSASASASSGAGGAPGCARKPQWTKRTPAASPPYRYQAGMAYDESRQMVVMYGGCTGAGGNVGAVADTWEWDGTSWANKLKTTGSALCAPAMAYDSDRAVVRLFGGTPDPSGCDQSSQQTWEYGGGAWTPVTQTGAPPILFGATMAYDRAFKRSVVFGGRNGACNPNAGLYEFTAGSPGSGSWAPAAMGGPSGRHLPGLAFDASHAVTVMFGGDVANDLLSDETWLWNGNGSGWVAAKPAHSPPKKSLVLAYDAQCKDVIGFGGGEDTWRWDGGDWSQLHPPAPTPGPASGMAYDAVHQRMVVLAGSAAGAETWVFGGD